jgi:hypothetical protein
VAEALEMEAWRRATGYQERKVERIWDKETGEWSDFKETVTDKASDAILTLLLKAHNPDKYSDKVKQEISGPGGVPLGSNGLENCTQEELESIRAIMLKANERKEIEAGS